MVGLAIPFLGALAPIRESTVDLEFTMLPVGRPVVMDADGFPLIILKPNAEQLANIRALDVHVAEREYSTFRSEIGAFVYWGVSTKRVGCALLEVKPSQPSRLVEWRGDAIWLGGYWDPICEVSYDYAGRAIKSYEFSFNGFVGEYPNLNSPLVVKITGNKLKVSRYGKPRFFKQVHG